MQANLPAFVGNSLESAVAELFMNATGKKVRKANQTIYHPKYRFIAANIDRSVIGEKSDLECKTCSAYKAREWDEEEIPQEYIIQCMHSLAVTGKERIYLAVLIGNQQFKWRVIERDERFIENLVDAEVKFWTKFVIPKIMPQVINRNDKHVLDVLYPRAITDKRIHLDDEAGSDAELLEGLQADEKDIKGRIETLKNRLKQRLGTAEVGLTSSRTILWLNLEINRFQEDAFRREHPRLFKTFVKKVPERRFYTRPLEDKSGESGGSLSAD